MTLPRVRIVCVGDSLTLGIANSELNRWPVLLALGLEKESPGLYEVFTRAANGATSVDALQKLEGEAGYLLPAIVLVTLGVNDALVRMSRRHPQVGVDDYCRNLEEMVEMVTRLGGRVVLVVAHSPASDARPEGRRAYVPGNGKTYRENYAPYREAMHALGRQLGVPVIDLPKLLADDKVKSEALVMEDGLHLTDEGNAIYARLIQRGLATELPDLLSTIERKPVQHG